MFTPDDKLTKALESAVNEKLYLDLLRKNTETTMLNYCGINTPHEEPTSFTKDMLSEAVELINALAPKKAPDNMYVIQCTNGLRILVNRELKDNTVIVSKNLFDKIYDGVENTGQGKPSRGNTNDG